MASVLLLLLCACLCTAQELLINPSFENGISDWTHDGFTMEVESTNVHHGLVSVKCSGRTHNWQGPAQNVNLKPDGRYYFSSYIKFIESFPAKKPQAIIVKIAITYKDGSKVYFEITARLEVTPADGWVHLGGNFTFYTKPYTAALLYLQGPAPEVSFYFDQASLKEIPDNPSWKSEANQRIEALRKSNIHFRFDVPSTFAAKDIEVQIDHVRHLFGFGSEMRSEFLVDPDYTQYQNIAKYMFNWATIQDYKWRYNRGTREQPDYRVAVAATDVLRKFGLKVRAGCIFWAVKGNEPKYVTPMTGQTLKDTVDERISYITNITRGKISHWDVNNELLHGRFFEDGTGDRNYSLHIYRTVHAADPVPALFLNDYDVVARGGHTLEYLEQIKKFKAANVGLGGVGVQTHLLRFVEPDITLIKARLDYLAQAGVPIWATELDLASNNDTERAGWTENVLRMFFSHPAVHGVILWGFWDQDAEPLMSMVHGYGYYLDDVGKRYLRLTKQEWSTHVNKSLADGTSFDVRGFQGDYNVTVWLRGKRIQRTSFFLGKSDKTINISIRGDGNEIHLPPEVNPFEHVDITHETTSRNLRTLGQASSTSMSQELKCVTRRSAESVVIDNAKTDVACNTGEVLTGCSSYLKNNDWRRDGEQIVLTNGQVVCRAIDGYRSTVGTQAVARCCSLKGLSCTYRTAGPSGTSVDDQVVVPCSSSEYPFGLRKIPRSLTNDHRLQRKAISSELLECFNANGYNFLAKIVTAVPHGHTSKSDGCFIANNSCISQNDDPLAGVFAYAACCHGNNIMCTSLLSTPSGQNVGAKTSVQCPSGSVLTGCNVYSTNGGAAGAYIEEKDGVDVCTAANAYKKYGTDIGVQAVATCCHN